MEPSTSRDALILRYLPLAHSLARRYRYSGQQLDDLIQVASIGLLKAVDGFDAAYGVKFESFAIPTILGELKRHHRDNGWSVRMPRRLQEQTLLLKEVVPTLMQDLSRSPSIAEIAKHTRLSVEEVLETLSAQDAYSSLSLDTPTDDETEGSKLSERLPTYDEEFEIADEWVGFLPHLRALPLRERQVLIYRFYRDWTQKQIADELGTSQMQVSRLLAQTLQKLRTAVNGIALTTPAIDRVAIGADA